MGLLVEVLSGDELVLLRGDAALPRLSSRRCYFQHVRHAAGPLQDVPWSEGEGNVIRAPAGGLHVWTRERRPHKEFSDFSLFDTFFVIFEKPTLLWSWFFSRPWSNMWHNSMLFVVFFVFQSHFSIKKGAAALGIGTESVICIKADERCHIYIHKYIIEIEMNVKHQQFYLSIVCKLLVKAG